MNRLIYQYVHSKSKMRIIIYNYALFENKMNRLIYQYVHFKSKMGIIIYKYALFKNEMNRNKLQG
ncbi:hypothetical protein FLJU110815_07350 [Flavobacterium jumunjinense]